MCMFAHIINLPIAVSCSQQTKVWIIRFVEARLASYVASSYLHNVHQYNKLHT